MLTSDIEDAGTDTGVWIRILGDKGVISETELDLPNKDDRQKGR